jgi:hypothetical protein
MSDEQGGRDLHAGCGIPRTLPLHIAVFHAMDGPHIPGSPYISRVLVGGGSCKAGVVVFVVLFIYISSPKLIL